MPDRKQFFWLFFSLRGRISPAVYFLAGLLVFIAQAFPLYRFTLVPPESESAQGWALVLLVTLLVSVWANLALTAKRLHDFGKPAAWALVTIVVGFIVFIILALVKGDPGPNRYGSRPNAPA